MLVVFGICYGNVLDFYAYYPLQNTAADTSAIAFSVQIKPGPPGVFRALVPPR